MVPSDDSHDGRGLLSVMTRALFVALVTLAACGAGTANPPGAGGAAGQLAAGGTGGGLAGAGGAAGSGLAGAGGAAGAVPPCPAVAGATIAITGKCLYDCHGGETDGGLLTGPVIPLCQLSPNQAEALGVFAPAYCVTTTIDPRCD